MPPVSLLSNRAAGVPDRGEEHVNPLAPSGTGSFPYHLVVGLLIVVAFAFLSRIVRWVIGAIGKKLIARTTTDLDDRILAVLLRNVTIFMVVTGLHIAVREVRKGVSAADVTANQILDYAGSLLYVAGVIVVVRILLGVIREFIGWYLGSISAEGAVNLKQTLGPLTSKVVNILVGAVAAIILLDHFGINIGSLLVSLGVGSLAVALAAQDTLANMIAGFVILVDRPFRVGDRIELQSGQVGDVHEIGLRSTTLLNFDANLIIIPNAELVKTRIINYAYPHNQMRAVVKVGVAYGTPGAKVRAILLRLAAEHQGLLAEPRPEVHCTALGDSSVEFTLIARATDFRKRFESETSLRERIAETFAAEGIEIPFPQRVVTTKQAP